MKHGARLVSSGNDIHARRIGLEKVNVNDKGTKRPLHVVLFFCMLLVVQCSALSSIGSDVDGLTCRNTSMSTSCTVESRENNLTSTMYLICDHVNNKKCTVLMCLVMSQINLCILLRTTSYSGCIIVPHLSQVFVLHLPQRAFCPRLLCAFFVDRTVRFFRT